MTTTTTKKSKYIKNPYECVGSPITPESPETSQEADSIGSSESKLNSIPFTINVNPNLAKKVKRLSLKIDVEFEDNGTATFEAKPVEDSKIAKKKPARKSEAKKSKNSESESVAKQVAKPEALLSGNSIPQFERVPSKELTPRKYDAGRKRREYFRIREAGKYIEAMKPTDSTDQLKEPLSTTKPQKTRDVTSE